MSGPRRQPTYAPWHENLPTHPKTLVAAAVLSRATGISADYANAVVCRAVPALVCYLIRESDDGRTDHLTDGKIVQVAWPSAAEPGGLLWGSEDLGVLRRALLATPDGYKCGFLMQTSRGRGKRRVERLHEFHAYAWAILRKRPTYAGTRLAQWLERTAPCGNTVENTTPLFELDANFTPNSGRTLHRTLPELGGELSPNSKVNSKDESPGSCELPGARAGGNSAPERAPPSYPSSTILSRREEISGLFGGRKHDETTVSSGWKGVPDGVRAGDTFAVAAFIRTLAPVSRVGLHEGANYMRRFQEHSYAPVTPAARAVSSMHPGRLFEVLFPVVFAELLTDLAPRIGAKKYPRSYAAKALAQRWATCLAQLADDAVEHRARLARERGRDQSG